MELTRYLLNQSGVHCVLSVKLSQDELESFFGKQQMKGDTVKILTSLVSCMVHNHCGFKGLLH